MKLKQLLPILFCVFLLAVRGETQVVKRSFTRQEAYSYSNLVGKYLDTHDTNIITKTELVMMFLEMDTIGRVTKIHLLAENQEEKSLYGVLKGITPEYFNNKRVIYNAREKTIIFPVYSMMYWADKNNYLDKMRTPWCPFFTEDMSAIVQEGMDFIQVNGTTHVVGIPKMEKPPVCTEPDVLSGKRISNRQAIYATVLSNYYGNSPASIVITDSTVNSDIIRTDYSEIAKGYSNKEFNIYFDKEKMDSTWISTLIKANARKTNLSNVKLPNFKPRCIYIRFISNDSLRAVGLWEFEKVFKVRDRVSVSNIILIGNRAIVEVNRMCGSLCGDGSLYFLEKRNGKWIVVTRMPLWIS